MMEARDTIYVGPALANTVRQCDGKVEELSFWTFSDVFEEGGPSARPFSGQFGLRAKGGINKPSYYGYSLLHQLGDRRIASASKDVIVTKTKDGGLAIAAWNLVEPDQPGSAQTIEFSFQGFSEKANVTVQRVDDDHGNVLKRYAAMGKPLDPTSAQIEQLNHETTLPAPERLKLQNGQLKVQLSPNALLLITVEPR
jgi:xylan 1,4-beta-xylosidase